MTEILLIAVIILGVVNLGLLLSRNSRVQTDRLEALLRQEMKGNREELARAIRELRAELNQTLNLSAQNLQDTLHRNLMTTNEMLREKFDTMARQQDMLVKSTE